MKTARPTRSERKAGTRAELLAAARRVFLARGFHGATLDEIAEEAGYTKGAVYSNFHGKDDLFLALLDEHYLRRVDAHTDLFAGLDADEPEAAVRGVARIMLDAYEGEPAWWTLVTDFSTHASRDPELRARLRELRERFLASMAVLIDGVGERYGLVYTVPTHEAARATGALLRGLMLDWILEPEPVDRADRARLFEETVTAFMRGASVRDDERSTA
jgi:AcrR family transcriptional regulator